MTDDLYMAGDLVAVVGGSNGKDGEKLNHLTLCEVLEIGFSDLVVKEHSVTKFKFSTTHIVPKDICIPIKISKSINDCRVLLPKVGDLVLSYREKSINSDNLEKKTGIVYEILYRNGSPSDCIVLSGEEMLKFRYKDLMVLHPKK